MRKKPRQLSTRIISLLCVIAGPWFSVESTAKAKKSRGESSVANKNSVQYQLCPFFSRILNASKLHFTELLFPDHGQMEQEGTTMGHGVFTFLFSPSLSHRHPYHYVP